MSSMYFHYSVVIFPWKMVLEKEIVKFRHFVFFIWFSFSHCKDPSSLILTKLIFLKTTLAKFFRRIFFFKMLSMYYHYLPTRKGPGSSFERI